MQNILDSSNNQKNSDLDISVQNQKGHAIEYSYFSDMMQCGYLLSYILLRDIQSMNQNICEDLH